MRRGFVLFGDGKFFKCINRKKVAHGAVSFVGWGVWVFSQGYVFASVFVSGFDQLLELVQGHGIYVGFAIIFIYEDDSVIRVLNMDFAINSWISATEPRCFSFSGRASMT